MASKGPVTSKARRLMTDLRSKFAEKSWNESMQLVRRCMEKTRGGRACEPIASCLRKINEALNVSSMAAMVSRLEMISKQRGLLSPLGTFSSLCSHVSATETVCYLTADLFYLEVLLLPGGGVEDVRVAHHGQPPVSSASLLQLLRTKHFEEFSLKLQDLISCYSIPGDSAEVKIKLYTALQHLETDLFKISHLPRSLRGEDLRVDLIMNGRIGNLQPGREGAPMSIEYFIRPLDVLAGILNADDGGDRRVVQVTVGSSDAPHRLQTDSLIPSPPPLDSFGFPVFRVLSDACSELLPATFLLRLQPPLPMLLSFVERLGQITGVGMEEHPRVAPLPELLMESLRTPGLGGSRVTDAAHFHPLPDCECHSYMIPATEWSSWGASLIQTVPFLHPAHVPELLNTLRQQTAINSLLESCFSAHAKHTDPGSDCVLWCELLPDSEGCFSLTFSVEESTQLSVLQVRLLDSLQARCRLLMPSLPNQHLDDFLSRVLTRCMSIPITMRALRRKLSGLLRCNSAESSPDPSSSLSPASPRSEAASALVSPKEELTPSSSSPVLCSEGDRAGDAAAFPNPSPSPPTDRSSLWEDGGFLDELR